MTDIDPGALANKYLELAARIEEMELQQTLIKDNLRGVLPIPDATVDAPSSWTYGEAVVQWVKGRKTKKLDEAKLRKVLVLAGVEIALIEGAFETATTEKTGDPTMRISHKEGA